jgi:two-component system cell cycle response regulator
MAEKKQNQMMQKLLDANFKIKEQQAAVIEQERLKVLLQMAGATAHELNQPLMYLLGSIDLMEMDKDEPAEQNKHITAIKEAGQRIANIIKRIQTLDHHRTVVYPGGREIIQLDEDVHILYLEDDDACFQTFKKLLQRLGLPNVSRAATIEEVKKKVCSTPYDIIFLDYKLPDGNGFDLLEHLGSQGVTIPAVMLTGQGNEKIASQAIKAGAYDYISKENINKASVFRCVNNVLEKFRLNQEINLTIKKMAEMSTKDELTGLFNRRYFNDALENEIARARRYQNEFALAIMDIDYFKQVNDTYGHQEGDRILVEMTHQLQKVMRQTDVLCRYGGEEFAIILPHTDKKSAVHLCERIRKKIFNHKFELSADHPGISISIGVAIFNSSKKMGQIELISSADKALYQAKASGRNNVKLFR